MIADMFVKYKVHNFNRTYFKIQFYTIVENPVSCTSLKSLYLEVKEVQPIASITLKRV